MLPSAIALLLAFTLLMQMSQSSVANTATGGVDLTEQPAAVPPAKPAYSGPALGMFGSVSLKASISPYAVKWADLKLRMEQERDGYSNCDNGNSACPPKVKAWREHLASLQDRPKLEQIRELNREINNLIAYRDDPVAFKKVDHWATPLESLRGRGDCEDYAILKFYSLLELGFSDDDIRLAIVRDTRRRLLHAVTTVDIEGRTYVLDNLFDEPVEHQYVLKYSPSYSANLSGQWVHIVTNEIRAKFVEQIQQKLIADAARTDPASRSAASRRTVPDNNGVPVALPPAAELRPEDIALLSAWT